MRFYFPSAVFLVIVFCSKLIAQKNPDNINILNGQIISSNSQTAYMQHLIGHDESGYYYAMSKYSIYKNVRSDLYIEHLNNNLENDAEKMMPSQESDFFDFFSMMKGNLYSFSTKKNKQNEFALSYQKINTKTLELEGAPKNIVTGQNYSNDDLIGPGYFSRIISPDESCMLLFNKNNRNPIVSVFNSASRNDTTFIQLTVFDSDMGKLWETEVQIPIAPQTLLIQQIKIDNAGTVYITALESLGKWGYIRHFHFFCYSKNKSDDIEMLVTIGEGKSVVDLQTLKKTNGDIVLAGLYADTIYGLTYGTFFMLVNSKDHMSISKNTYAFEPEFIDEYNPLYIHSKARPHKPGFLFLYMSEIIEKENGDIAIIAQQYLQMPEHEMSSYDYYYDDIIIVNYNNQGSVSWATKIPKRQNTHEYATNDDATLSSFTSLCKNNKIYFIYNDNPENYPPKKGEIKEFTRKSDYVVILTTVEEDGFKSSQEISVAPEKDLKVLPLQSLKINSGQLIIHSYENDYYEFSKIEFH